MQESSFSPFLKVDGTNERKRDETRNILYEDGYIF